MKRPHSIPVFVSLAFLLGCGLGFHWTPGWPLLGFIGLGLLLLLVFALIRAQRLFFQDMTYGLVAFLMIVFIGVFNTQVHLPQNQPSHYLHHTPSGNAYLRLRIDQQLRPNAFQHNFIAHLEQIDERAVHGKVLLSISRDSLSKLGDSLVTGTEIQAYTTLNDIYGPLNPFQFDYGLFMENKRILKQIRSRPEQLSFSLPTPTNLRTRASLWRRQLKQGLEKSRFSAEHIALMEALLLGQRTELSRETYAKFADAGVVHILAVSGLHVGIILYLLSILFKPLTYLPYGKTVRVVFILVLLWGYALVAGFSPSILRAVSMFSFLSIGLLFKRRFFSINMLCLSGLVLLLINPYFLKDIGFQLSYSAVLSILILYPKLYRLVPLNRSVVRYVWGVVSVTLAAQIGVLPLSLFYFHQLPGLFFLTNLLIVPFLGIIIGLGALTLLFVQIGGSVPAEGVWFYGGILDGLLWVIDTVAGKEKFLFKHLYFSKTMLIFSLMSLVFFSFWLYKRKINYLLYGLLGLFAFQLFYIVEQRKVHQIKTFYVFHKSRYSAFGFQENRQLYLQTNTPLEELGFLEGLQNAYGISDFKSTDTLHNYYRIGDHQLLVVDEFEVYKLPDSVKPTAILLRNSPQINVDRMLQKLQPQIVIADGSNYKNLVAKWKQSCQDQGIPFHPTAEKGAYRISY